MARANLTVQDVWREYDTGINGGPSIRWLDASYRASWRKSNAEAQMYARRKWIWLEVERISGDGDVGAAIDLLQQRMDASGWSLHTLSQHLKTEHGERAIQA